MTAPARQIITADVVVTCDVEHRVFEPGWVRIVDGRIDALGAGAPDPLDILSSDLVDVLHVDLLMPGLISAHQHPVDVLVRGGPIGPTFHDWLFGTFHAGLAHATDDDSAMGIAVVRSAGLAAGITTIVDCWSVGPVDDPARFEACAVASIEAHIASGGRTVFAPMFCEIVPAGMPLDRGIDPQRLCRPYQDTLDMVARLDGGHRGDRLSVTPSPELPDMCTAEGLRAAHEMATAFGTKLPMHTCTSPPSRAACGPDELEAFGLLGPDLLAAHCSALDDTDIARIGGAGVGVAHCPSSSRALGGTKLTPMVALRRAGASGGLGLDNQSLQAGSDLFSEARQAILGAAGQGDVLSAQAALDLLTAEGARTIGLGDRCGSIEVGRFADLVALDTSRAHWWPRGSDWPTSIITCARADDVELVMVAGAVVARGGLALVGGDHHGLDAAARRIRTARGWS
ncbi:MAG: amidohydrolase [Ilumatobacteraceae bacterium]|nr:amidohydrolase [Ilumatobacteraceae bacterium]